MASKREPPSRIASASSLRSATGSSSLTRTRQAARTSMRPPLSSSRFNRDGAVSPAESMASVATTSTKRKDREYDTETGGLDHGEETNIQVVVRCRGRNEREVRENSTVVVSADAAKGKDMLAGFNCTIFAYGQTGTGKTYTMSGDMTETMGLLSDAAGIIPRALQALFNKLEADDCESAVKCSFIELYNEELRDLIAVEEGAKLKIFDDTSRKGHATTIVQGMEEKHIKTAGEGIKVLQDGSLKRQVAATKCNDLSSRSHTVFTVTAYVKRKNEDGGEDYVSAGKLNLVDLAGSENIQRSGAENKRAAEAGLINKSLLTLGRVINALVDRSQHIPYRESKLTRLLQDSLGGRTKTCIIATVSPAKSNLEETISTLDYAFRAKNIRNKPQVNPLLNKKKLLREFQTEIEKLKSELITTRQRNGVYLSNASYEEMTAQSESRRIVLEEQAAKMETLEMNLKNKVHELLSLTSNFMGLKKDHDGTKAQLDDTRDVLDQTELVLDATRRSLADETHLRKAHQETEGQTHRGRRAAHLDAPQDGRRRRPPARQEQAQVGTCSRSTRGAWGMAQGHVVDITSLVEQPWALARREQEHVAGISERSLSSRFKELLAEQKGSKEEMDNVLEEIKTVRDTVKDQVGESLQSIAAAAEKIAADVLSELGTFHNQLHTSYRSLGKDFKTIFDDLVTHIAAQRAESLKLRQQLEKATRTIAEQNAANANRMQEVMEGERKQAAVDRRDLLTQITSLINAQAEVQESRLADKTAELQRSILASNTTLEKDVAAYGEGMDAWNSKEDELLETVANSKEAMKTKLKEYWNAAEEHSSSIQGTTKSVNAETMRVVDEQLENLDVQMKALDDFVTHARDENASHHEKHAESVQKLSETVGQSFEEIASHCATTFDRVQDLGSKLATQTEEARQGLAPIGDDICQPLAALRDEISSTVIQEYQPTGDTPMKMHYQFPTDLPKTKAHEKLLNDLHGVSASPSKSSTIPTVFADDDDEPDLLASSPRQTRASTMPSISEHAPTNHTFPFSMSLREVNPNLTQTNLTTAGSLLFDPAAGAAAMKEAAAAAAADGGDAATGLLPFKYSTSRQQSKIGRKTVAGPLEGRENVPLPVAAFSQSLGPRRKSPRLN
ncbi:kinesin-II 85 kDa subunit [Verticillium alfalfae VaMs.102]|uniref:Kinesin-II 85 kDa subunit n=1 Tax=Verticillium alfalfae (strain VaMs.102 / ATCC MYA-4576 / FGSC 10136) TaxID=526221 RepID=C9SR02_VERA1|nr:kinesin-II 85 kDa subunit [Verticillium alfalfae VaMs.102]EEY21277.1 kinesin-II 85 kDa subunit [Verticillium alfalfae VaMs.102]